MIIIPTAFIPLSVMSALLTMISQRTHILMTLLALEAMILNLMIMAMITSNSSSPNELFLIMILLSFGACEAALGLACLVKLTRAFGNDQISSSYLNSC